MPESRVSIAAAFGEAWERMKAILFRPFDLGKWLALGFSAWLAGLTGNGGGGGGGWNLGAPSEAARDLEGTATEARSVLREAWEESSRWLLENPFWLIAGILGCGLLIAFFLVILWVSSRGKFMFLDNVVHDRAEVVAPWKRFRRLGNSHFFFQLAFSAAVVVFVVGLIVAILASAGAAWQADLDTPLPCLLAAAGVLLFTPIILAVVYIQYFLDGFVVPLMHRFDLRVMAAWSRFWEIFRRHAGKLLLSGLFLFVLVIAVGLSILVAGLLTCCIGFLFLVIPYIGTVLILPVPVTYRAFTVALLDQIDPGYFPRDAAATAEGTPTAPLDAPPTAG